MTLKNVNVRRAAPADFPHVLTLVQALAHHHDDTPVATLDSLALDLEWGTIFLVAEVDDQIIGYAALLPLAQIQFGRRGLDMHHLYVQAAFRGLRVGRALIDAAQDVARDAGCTYLMVGTDSDNVQAQAAYRASGFLDAPVGGFRFGMNIT